MQQVNKILALILLFIPFSGLIAQVENYDAVYLSLVREYTLEKNGSIEFRYKKQLRLQNYRAFNRLFGETFVVYNSDHQTLTINRSYTTMADGKKIETPANAFNEVLPRIAAHSPAFNHLREMVITHTALEVGATIFLDYTIHSERGFLPALMEGIVLAEDQPIMDQTIIVRTPADQPLHFHLFNSAVEPRVDQENGLLIYTWKFEELPAVETEKLIPPPTAVYPTLIFSTIKGYSPIAKFFSDQEAFRYGLSETMKQYVSKLTASRKEKKEILFALQDAVVKEVNLWDIQGNDLGYAVRPPGKVWNTNGGTVAEKAVLLTAFLREAGIMAEPVLVFDGPAFDREIGTLGTLEEWIVRAELPGMGKVYLSVKEINAYDMTCLKSGNVMMVLRDDATFQTLYPEPTKALLSVTGILKIDSSMAISGDLTVHVTGPANPYLSFIRSEQKAAYYFEGGFLSGDIQGIVFQKITPEESIFSCHVKNARMTTTNNSFYSFSFPVFGSGFWNFHMKTLPTEFKEPFKIPFPIGEQYDFTFAFPETVNLYIPGKHPRINNRSGSCEFQIEQRKGVIHVKKELVLNQTVTPPNEYDEVKALIDDWNIPATNWLYFGTSAP